MTPRFAQAVDPILLHVLGLLDRIQRGEQPAPQDERLRVRALIDQGEAIVGSGPEWEAAKYALASWSDEMLIDSPWEGHNWWSNNALEVELFQTRSCFDQFFIRAQEVTTLARRDALEVYYVCVVLGFRGLYRDPDMASSLIQNYGLAPDLESWAKQAALAVRLGQGRPALPAPVREVAGAPPQRGRAATVWTGLALLALLAGNLAYLAWSGFRL
ncbi:MAG TPA: DotU family type IV/VI secretion system protein [Pirellulaceae bacterium]|nr:DotU family type IV/VI secretion system protein [Pirellulaceae bacterium]